jgi:protein-tyrosine phosphatase
MLFLCGPGTIKASFSYHHSPPQARDFIEGGRAAGGGGGRVLVHCRHGVNRSGAMVVAYIMWKT